MNPRYAEGVARLSSGRFWHAHEVWEELWRESGDDYYKGLIQLAAGLFHLRRGNFRGARRLLRTSQEYLARRGESGWLGLTRQLSAAAERERPVELNLDALATLCSSDRGCLPAPGSA